MLEIPQKERYKLRENLLPRLWFYFRTGYGQYFGFIIALANMFTITYYLLLDNISYLDNIFPSFSVYVIISSIIGIPLLVIIGFLHIKTSHAYRSEADISTESFPYFYKLLPGIQIECLAPLYLELIRLGRKSLLNEKLNEEEKKKLRDLENKLEWISEGKMLDIPKKFDDL